MKSVARPGGVADQLPPLAARAGDQPRGDPPVRTMEDRLAEIGRLDVPALRLAWEDMFGRLPPNGLSRRLLERAAAYGAQAKIHGGLKPSARRQLLRAARALPRKPGGAPRQRRQGAPPPGSRLVREWNGRSHTVEVAEHGFLYAGRRYRSLSEIARTITGARWSGPRFFGL
jgi:hypothetical protein